MTINDFIYNYKNATGCGEGLLIEPNTIFKDLGEWDSVIVLNLIAMIDEEYDILISFEEINECENIKELFELVAQKK